MKKFSTLLIATLAMISGPAMAQYYVLNDATEHSLFMTASTDEYAELTGPADTLYFDAKTQSASISPYIYPMYTTDGSNWTTMSGVGGSLKTSYNTFWRVLPENTYKVKFKGGGSLSRYVKNVKVSMAKYIKDPSATALSFDSVEVGQESATQQFTIDACNAGQVNVESDNDAFVVDFTDNITGYGVNLNDANDKAYAFTRTITVKFAPTTTGEQTGTITISSAKGSKTVSVSGTGWEEETPTSLNEASTSSATDKKFFRNGRLYIRKNSRVYDVNGQYVK